jgi:hypothetical protein
MHPAATTNALAISAMHQKSLIQTHAVASARLQTNVVRTAAPKIKSAAMASVSIAAWMMRRATRQRVSAAAPMGESAVLNAAPTMTTAATTSA